MHKHFLCMRVLWAMHVPVLRGTTRNTNYFLLNFGKETMQGVMIKSWKAEIYQVPTLLADAIVYGLSKLGYESIKPEQWQ